MNIVSGGDPGYIALKRLLRRLFPGKGNSYADKVRSIFGSNLIGYWQLNEPSGTVAKDYSSTGANGTYNSVTLAQVAGPGPSMGLAPQFDGINDNVTFAAGPLAALNGAWNPDEITLILWAKMIDITHWNNATEYDILMIGSDSNNRIYLAKTVANTLGAICSRNGSIVGRALAGQSGLAWICLSVTISKSANIFRFYVNGAQIGIDQAVPNTFIGSLTSATTQIGSSGGAFFWPGNLAHIVLAKVAATPAQVAQLAVAA